MIKILKKIDELCIKVLFFFTQISIIALLVLLTAQVVSRYFRIQFLAPPDEIVNLFFAYFVFIGIALLFHEDGHLRVEFIDGLLGNKSIAPLVYQLFTLFSSGVFIVILMSSSTNLFITSGQRLSPMLSLPQRMWYFSIVFSAYFMGIHCVLKIIGTTLDIVKLTKEKE